MQLLTMQNYFRALRGASKSLEAIVPEILTVLMTSIAHIFAAEFCTMHYFDGCKLGALQEQREKP